VFRIVDADAGRAADAMGVEKAAARAAVKALGHGLDRRGVCITLARRAIDCGPRRRCG
jgi:hypothetical protein